MAISEKNLELLAAHYNDSYSIIKTREEQRDRLFLIAVAVVGFLAFTIVFPSTLQGLLKEFELTGVKMQIANVPIAILTSLAWTLLLIFLLRYYQSVVTIDRQYKYLHDLENQIAPEFGENNIFHREGKAYKEEKSLLTHWIEFLYTIVLPVILVAVLIGLLLQERELNGSWTFNLWYDALLCCGVMISLLAYLFPQILRRFQRLKKDQKKKT